jgi:hypothetical protein
VKILMMGTGSGQDGHLVDDAHQADSHKAICRIGESIAEAGHQLLICSPFPDSADYWAFEGARAHLSAENGPSAELHYPRVPEVTAAAQELVAGVSSDRVRHYTHPVMEDGSASRGKTYSWLLAQIAAMDQSHAIVAVGGKLNGSAKLLLALAESRQKFVLPLRFLGGAAEQYFDRHYYQLRDKLGDDVDLLSTTATADKVVELIQALRFDQHLPAAANKIPRFFLSYAKQRPSEADLVEMMLRRRGLTVIRDDAVFEEGESITNSIKEEIHKSDVFIALWCKEYACSPWCYDELSLALQRHKAGMMKLWLICIDNTRIVPPEARDLLFVPALSRDLLSLEITRLVGELSDAKSSRT